MKPPTMSYLSNIYFEPGAVDLLPELLSSLGISNPLVVTDNGLLRAGILGHLRLNDPPLFAEIETNPTEASTLAGLAVYQERSCDGIVAAGGGSPIDCAKCIGLLAAHPQPLEQYAFLKGGLPKITRDKPPLVAIPTTAGTGSEVGRASLITMSGGGKMAFISPHLIPDAVICDPNPTLDLPAGLTAATGMDAVAHCVENYCSPRFNPVADAIALDGLGRAWKNLPLAYGDGGNLDARSEMMVAALQGGLTMQKGLGLVHSLSHPLGGLPGRGLHHGTLNAVFLPHVLRFNMEACANKMDPMAKAIGIGSRNELPDRFDELTRSLALPATLGAMGVTREDVAPLSEKAFADHCCLGNPRKVTLEDCRCLYEAAI